MDPTLFRIGCCEDCGDEFPAGRAGPVAKRCAPCREDARRQVMYARWREERLADYAQNRRHATCETCGGAYERHIRDTKSVKCPPCRAAAKAEWKQRWAETNADKAHQAKRKWLEANRDKMKAYKHRRRVLARDADSDTFTAREVFERDGWVCQLCGLDLDPDVKFPDPTSASVDHIIPVVLGGTHTWDNVQTACMGCNWSKGARMT